MLVQNVLAVFLVQAEARNRALLAGLLDCLMWPAGMVTTMITVTALQSHHAGLKSEGDRGGHAGQLRRLLGCGEGGQAVHQGAASVERYCHQRRARPIW
jgi:hypothetical protein